MTSLTLVHVEDTLRAQCLARASVTKRLDHDTRRIFDCSGPSRQCNDAGDELDVVTAQRFSDTTSEMVVAVSVEGNAEDSTDLQMRRLPGLFASAPPDVKLMRRAQVQGPLRELIKTVVIESSVLSILRVSSLFRLSRRCAGTLGFHTWMFLCQFWGFHGSAT